MDFRCVLNLHTLQTHFWSLFWMMVEFFFLELFKTSNKHIMMDAQRRRHSVYLSVTLQNMLRTWMCYTFCSFPPKKWNWVLQEPKPPLHSLFNLTVYLSIYLSRLHGFPGFQLKGNTMQKKKKKQRLKFERIAMNSSPRGCRQGTLTPEEFLCLLSMFNIFKAKVCLAQLISYQQSFSSWVWFALRLAVLHFSRW